MVYKLTWLVAGGADETAAGLGVRGEVSESATDPPQSRTGSAPLDDSPFSISTTVLTSLSIELSDSIFSWKTKTKIPAIRADRRPERYCDEQAAAFPASDRPGRRCDRRRRSPS